MQSIKHCLGNSFDWLDGWLLIRLKFQGSAFCLRSWSILRFFSRWMDNNSDLLGWQPKLMACKLMIGTPVSHLSSF
jgi:hypothetical protein